MVVCVVQENGESIPLAKSKGGESCSQSSHHSNEGSHEMMEEGESHHLVVLYEPPPRAMEPEE